MKAYLAIAFICFLLGIFAGIELAGNETPKVLWLERENGKIAYVELDIKKAKTIQLEKVDDPGAYLALPLYAENNEMGG